jgi:ATP-dependent helicase/nuclease subunit A
MSALPLLSEVVVAGAGTGKTHALVNAYLFALLGLDAEGKERAPSRILAITFTDKAASEMRRRVALRLQALVRDPHADVDVNERAAAFDKKVPEARALERMLRQLPGAPISTFHTLCSSLLRDMALNADLDPGFVVLDPVAESELLVETSEGAVLDRLAAGDPEVAELSARFSLRRFGRASGLVESLVQVHDKLAERGLSPADVKPAVLVAEAEARTTEQRGRCDRTITELWELVKGADERSRAQLQKAFKLYRRLRDLLDANESDEEQELARVFLDVRNALERARPRGQALSHARDNAVTALMELGAALCDRVTAPHALALTRLLVDLAARVQLEKDQRGVLGFGDMLLRTRDLLRDHPSVRARVKARFDRVLVDEYQDTSPVQEDVVALLSEEPSRGDIVPEGERAMGWLKLQPGRLFVVGDPKQSIYGFRGADVQVFRHTHDVIVNGTERCEPSGQSRPLAESWRSRPPLLELTNQVALQTLPVGPVGVEVRPEDLLRARRAGEGRAGALWRPTDSESLEPEQAEALVLARSLRKLLDEGLLVSERTVDGEWERPCRPGDVAVLLRRVKSASPIARALAHQGIPTIITGGEGFFRRPEVMDLIAALQLVVEPEDDLATLTVLRSPLVALSDDALVQITEGIEGWRRGLAWHDVPGAATKAGLDDDALSRIHALDALLRALRAELHRMPASRMVDALVDEGGYALAVGVERDAQERLANVEKLRAVCEGRPGDALRTIHRLWGWLDDPPQEGIAATGDPDADAVRIMTIHQAKGLEFPIVILADVGSQLPTIGQDLELDPDLGLAVSFRGRPIEVCSWRAKHLVRPAAIIQVREQRFARERAELARVLYVALTRARDHLFVVGEERENKQVSLRRLLEDGRKVDARAFSERLPTAKVPAKLGPRRELPVSRLPDVAFEAAPPAAGPSRLVPSALVEPLPGEEAALVAGGEMVASSGDARRRGRLAHLLLGRLGETLEGGALPDQAAVWRAASAGARSLGEDVEAPANKALLAKVVVTVHGPLRRLVEAGYSLAFEEPVRFTLGDKAVVVGACDLVARGAEWTVVVEFKSSRRAADDPATAVQLAAYAHALQHESGGQLRVAAWVIGEEEPPAPGGVSDDAHARLQERLAEASR